MGYADDFVSLTDNLVEDNGAIYLCSEVIGWLGEFGIPKNLVTMWENKVMFFFAKLCFG